MAPQKAAAACASLCVFPLSEFTAVCIKQVGRPLVRNRVSLRTSNQQNPDPHLANLGREKTSVHEGREGGKDYLMCRARKRKQRQ